MTEIEFNRGIGFAVIMGIILLIVIIYTIISLRKQVSKRKAAEDKKHSKIGRKRETKKGQEENARK
ncbi:hypothetical protein [Salinimicrobium sp. GXAS 041]|uniref:hypothetical protein n=1 Tax=Salinimicrobium sp. GXAS 041 TaxID=3400806 RepID=UPI003C74E4F3